jgi:hypothetical protein
MSPSIIGHRSRSKWLLVVPCALLVGAGCGSSSEGPVGGVVAGALDDHCAGVEPVVVSQASCEATPPGGDEETPDVHYNAEADDDDCKYHVSFTNTPIRRNENVTFTVTASLLAGAKGPVTCDTGQSCARPGSEIIIEGILGTLNPLPNNGTTTKAGAPGVYTISPVKFDKPGRWTITYHLFEDCHDLVDSPHGHASFYIDVP